MNNNKMLTILESLFAAGTVARILNHTILSAEKASYEVIIKSCMKSRLVIVKAVCKKELQMSLFKKIERCWN